ncbi:winged helix DNA-binding domain-containing protein [Streptomyces sp. NRRL F-5123]|uniref:winged helix DNA-binding domain-containing protein n=1 Tax=Streptomyces sp. NRRL F-5123 TaxID=1463856 RepID=UPI0004E10060|nr:winged helix DNA-binding domain-containing protein [Streptomyces sp. NRRL F-5123]
MDVVRGVVALHATDPATVYLSVAARMADPGTAFAGLDAALYGEPPALTRMLAMRRTMFVVDRDFAPQVYAAAGRRVTVKMRKDLLAFLAEGGGWDAAWLADLEAEVVATLAAHPDTSGAELSRLVPRLREQVVVARGKPYEATQNIASRVIRMMAAEGRIERRRPAGSWISGQFRWANAEPLPDVPEEPARAALARAWLAAYGPGTEADLKWWTGWGLGETRKALAAVGAEAVAFDDGATGYVLPDAGPDPADQDGAVLLPALDPLAMAWRDRAWFLPDGHEQLFDRSGNIGPTVWWGGEVVGGWAQRPDGSIAWRLLCDRGVEVAEEVERAAARLTPALGSARVTPRFRTPLERALSA